MTVILLAGTAILFAGCNKQNEFGGRYSRQPGAPVVFGVDSRSIMTRTSYGADATEGGKTIQAINWTAGDKIRIYSPDCNRASWDSPEHWADYTVSPTSGDASLGTLTNVQPVGLAWTESGTHTFYAVYPSPETTEDNTPDGASGTIALSMPAAQLVTDEMQYAFMTAATEVTTTASENAVELDFYPAFTAFEISLTADEDLELVSFALISADTPVAGAFTVSYSGTTATYNCTGTGKRIDIADLGNDAEIGPGNPFSFNVFCLPQELKGLKIAFTIRKAGATETETRSLTLNDKNGAPVAFAACHKHRITGQMQGSYNFKYITLTGDVLDWEAETVTEHSDDLPQAGQFNVSANVKNVYQLHNTNEGKALRQTWVLGSETATVTFKVFSPEGGTWEIEPQGATDKFTVTYGGSAVTGAFYGHINSRSEEDHGSGATVVTFTVKASGAAAGDRIWFKTYVYDGANRTGTKFSMDSETQLYDMRGFHYFRIDDPLE
ncbi:MAG: fimbrillin family protein [Bacteroidales bacterium]|nr:fimbrillin family protein [Bacteroidales bacterium]